MTTWKNNQNPKTGGTGGDLEDAFNIDGFFAVSLFDFDGNKDENQISFRKNDSIYIYENLDTGWSAGRNPDGDVGYIPTSYIEKVTSNSTIRSLSDPLAKKKSTSSPTFSSSSSMKNISDVIKEDEDDELVELSVEMNLEEFIRSLIRDDDLIDDATSKLSQYCKEHGILLNNIQNTALKLKLNPNQRTKLNLNHKRSSSMRIHSRGPPPPIARKSYVFASLLDSKLKAGAAGRNMSVSSSSSSSLDSSKSKSHLKKKPRGGPPPTLPKPATPENTTYVSKPGDSPFNVKSLLVRKTYKMGKDDSKDLHTSKPGDGRIPRKSIIEIAKDELKTRKEVEKKSFELRQKKIDAAAKVAKVGVSMLPLEIRLEIESFSIAGYAQMYFQKNTGKNTLFGSKHQSLEGLLSFSDTPITASLNHLEPEMESEVLVLFQNIMEYMGDGPSTCALAGTSSLRHKISKASSPRIVDGVKRTDIGDEIYCQLMKQMTNNPEWSSEWRGWQLLAACLAIHPPSEHLQHYVVGFIVSNCKNENICGALAGYCLRKAYGEHGVVSDESLGDASRMIISKNIYGGNVHGIIYMESLVALLISQGLQSVTRADYGASEFGISRKSSSIFRSDIICPFLSHRDLLVNGCTMYKKLYGDKNYTERWISLSPCYNFIQWEKNKGEKKPKQFPVESIIGIESGIPKIINKNYFKEHSKKIEQQAFTIKSKKHKEGLDLCTHAEPERDLWVFALKSLLNCKQKKHEHQAEDFDKIESALESYDTPPIPEIHNVPRIVSYLTKAIVMNGGFEAVGIFRLSVAASDEAYYSKCLNEGMYGKINEIKDPCIAAVLIKKWLRSLNPRLIPEDLYYDAIAAGEKENIEMCIAVTKRLKEFNYATLEFICRFLNEMSKHEEVTKMGTQNFAVVITPNIMRNPGEDAAEMLRNNGHEMNFTRLLIENAHLMTTMK